MTSDWADEARDHLGYRALPNRASTYGQVTGYPNQTWNGSFIQVITGEKTVSTVAALSNYVRENRIFRVPRVGDLVFYAFSNDGTFGQPHIGIVTDTSEFKRAGRFKAIEGQTESGLRRGNQDATGVFERVRFDTEVLAFARPKIRAEGKPNRKPDGPAVRPSTVQPNKTNGQIETVQRALGRYGLRDAARGTFDNATRAAYARFQRLCGRVGADASGVPDTETLTWLSERDGRFTVRD